MVATVSVLDKALNSLKIQRSKNLEFGGNRFSTGYEPSFPAPGPSMSSRLIGSPGSLSVHWAPTLEAHGGNHLPGTVAKPAKPILKVREFNSTGFVAQAEHWNEGSDAIESPTSDGGEDATETQQQTTNKPHSLCIKLVARKRSREMAFAQ